MSQQEPRRPPRTAACAGSGRLNEECTMSEGRDPKEPPVQLADLPLAEEAEQQLEVVEADRARGGTRGFGKWEVNLSRPLDAAG